MIRFNPNFNHREVTEGEFTKIVSYYEGASSVVLVFLKLNSPEKTKTDYLMLFQMSFVGTDYAQMSIVTGAFSPASISYNAGRLYFN